MDSPNFSNQQQEQEQISRKLNSRVSPGAAAFWRDACRLMEMEPLLESTTHLVGHLLREIESSLRDVLMPISEPSEQGANKKKPSGDEKHKAEIEAVLKVLEIPEISPVAQTWLSLPGRNNKYGLHKRAHRKALDRPRPIDSEFREFWNKMQAVLDGVLDRFEAKYAKVFCLLDELAAKHEPTKQDLEELCNSIPNSFATRRYFFDRLHSPGWLNKLQQEGFFQNPPEPEEASEGGEIRLLWPQSRYLVRMASQKPAIVLEIGQEILKTGTKNTSVHQDLVEAALVMPPKLAADWVKEETTREFFPAQLIEELRREFTKLVESNPERFVLQAEKFKELKPRYIAAIFSGLLIALGQKTGIKERENPQFPWSLMLDFCSWVLEQSKANSGCSNADGHHSSEWSWAGEAVVDLLKTGLEVRGKNEIPFHLRPEFWEVLRSLLTDHSNIVCPTSYHSSKLVNRSFNIVSSAAMHTVIHYAFWVRQQAVQNFDEMPEVREILESHLARNKDSSPVIQAVYGYWFPWLVTLDLDWTTQNLERIFPKDESLRELRDAAWEGYITSHSADAKLFNILREEYSNAIEQIGTSTHEWQHPPQSDQRLAEHMMQFYWNGVLNLDESDSLLERFFAKAPEQHRKDFMRSIGGLASNNQSKIEPEFLERLQQFWEWRVSTALSSPAPDLYTSELKTFDRWFASGKFDSDWAITQLKEVLRLAKDVNDHYILRHIAAFTPSKPLDAFECFQLIANGTRAHGFIYRNQESSRIILSTALQYEDEEIRKAAKELINRLLFRGIDFRDLPSDGEV